MNYNYYVSFKCLKIEISSQPAKVSPKWRLNPGFGTQKEGPFPLNRCVPLIEVTDTKIM